MDLIEAGDPCTVVSQRVLISITTYQDPLEQWYRQLQTLADLGEGDLRVDEQVLCLLNQPLVQLLHSAPAVTHVMDKDPLLTHSCVALSGTVNSLPPGVVMHNTSEQTSDHL